MQMFRLGVQMFSRRLGLSILLAVQLAIGILLVNFTFLQIETMRSDLRPVEPLQQEKAVYVMRDYSVDPDSAAALSGLPGVKGVSTMRTRFLQRSQEEPDGIRLVSYDSNILKRLPMPLKKGNWVSGVQEGTDGIPVVIGKETGAFRLGASVTVYGREFDGEQERTVPLQIKVVGVLDTAQRYLSFERGGNGVSLLDLIKRNDSNYSGEILLLGREEDLGEYPLLAYASSPGSLVFFDSSLTDAQMEENAQSLSRDNETLTVNELMQAAQKEMNGRWALLLPFIVCALTISLVGIISSGALHARLEARNFAVYYVCGARWKNCLTACAGYSSVLLFTTLLLVATGLSCMVLSGFLEDTGFSVTLFNAFLTAVILLIAACAYVLPSYVTLKRIKPIQLLHENE